MPMQLFEALCNLHMHTPYSDGEWYHAQIAEAALNAGLDMVVVTDHNVWVKGPERYYEADGRRVLLLVGEEVHDPARRPQKNHLLAYNANCELARHAPQPQALIDTVRSAGGLAFLAHPFDFDAPLFNYENISWVNWEVNGYAGLEVWNYMSSWAELLTSKPNAIRYAFNPETGLLGPPPKTLAKWDELTTAGRRVVGLGNSDAHATEYSLWGLTRRIFPYEFLFRQINTHIITSAPLTGEFTADRDALMMALAAGRCFVAYDGIAPTRGFRFSASTERGHALMGDEITNGNGLTLQVSAPQNAQLRLLHNGREIVRREGQANYTHLVPPGERGVFRVEAHLPFKGRLRTWILSNPIYVR